MAPTGREPARRKRSSREGMAVTSNGESYGADPPHPNQNHVVALTLVQACAKVLPCEPAGERFKDPIGRLVPRGWQDATNDIDCRPPRIRQMDPIGRNRSGDDTMT